jgi:hypothetical protein
MATSDYDELKKHHQAIDAANHAEEQKRLAALEKANEELRAKNAHGYPSLDEAHHRITNVEAATRQIDQNVRSATDPVGVGMLDSAGLPPAQIDREVAEVTPQVPRGVHHGDAQLAPGGTMFTSVPGNRGTLTHEAKEEPQNSPDNFVAVQHEVGNDPRVEMTEGKVTQASNVAAQEMTEHKVELQQFRVRLTEQQKDEAAELTITISGGRGGR